MVVGRGALYWANEPQRNCCRIRRKTAHELQFNDRLSDNKEIKRAWVSTNYASNLWFLMICTALQTTKLIKTTTKPRRHKHNEKKTKQYNRMNLQSQADFISFNSILFIAAYRFSLRYIIYILNVLPNIFFPNVDNFHN